MGYIPNLYNFWIVAYVAVGATACSYGLAIIGSTVGQPSFYRSLNLVADPTAPGYDRTAGLLGAFNGVNAAGAFIGAISEYVLIVQVPLTNNATGNAWLANKFSRKYTAEAYYERTKRLCARLSFHDIAEGALPAVPPESEEKLNLHLNIR